MAVSLPQFRFDAAFVVAAREAEALGFDRVAVYDHVFPLGRDRERPVLESTAVLAAVAAETVRIGLGPLVLRSTLRPPAVAVAAARTLAAACPGRDVVVGVGIADRLSRDENISYGITYPGADERATLALATIRGLKATGLTVWGGGRGPRARALVAHADGHNLWGAPPEEVRRAATAAAASGRTVSWGGNVSVAGSRTGVISGTPAALAGALGEYVAAGADDLVLGVVDHAELPALAEMVDLLRAGER